MKQIFIYVLLFCLQACSYLDRENLVPSAQKSDIKMTKLFELKAQETRRAQINNDKNESEFVAIITYLNELGISDVKKTLFLVEIYEKHKNKNLRENLRFVLHLNAKEIKEFKLESINKSEYTDLIRPSNNYNRLFLLEFDEFDRRARENLRLDLFVKNIYMGNKSNKIGLKDQDMTQVDTEGERKISFDFGYSTMKNVSF